jgi:DNA segregation ATPase FtsK/SpoIIIE, S-DNA-T family
LSGKLEIPLGFDRTGQMITTDLSHGEPHLLIAGETGSGKSTVLRSIITNLILNNDCDLLLVDLKYGAEFKMFQNSSRVKEFARTRNEAEKLLQQVSTEVNRRYDLFYDKNCIDIKQYNQQFKNKLKYQILIIDEFADLMNEKRSTSIIEELAAKARACGIHLIIATQRPDAQVISGRIKANVTSVLGLKALNDINSRIIIGHEGLENLRGKGHAIFKRGMEIELQCPYLDEKRVPELISYTYVEKKKREEEKNGEPQDLDFLNKRW